jgi:hypothetical protein
VRRLDSGLIAKQPGLSLEEILAAMAKQGRASAFFQRHNVNSKKCLHTKQSKGEPTWLVHEALDTRADMLDRLDPARLLLLDETVVQI